MSWSEIIRNQEAYFNTNITLDVSYRKKMLNILKEAIKENEQHIIDALYADFKKPETEVLLTELSMLYLEIDLHIKKLAKWSQAKNVMPSFLNFPSKDQIVAQPYGNVLIISPWNYPFLLALHPLISSIAAGNCTFLKVSEISYHTGKVIKQIIDNHFPSAFIHCEMLDVAETTRLLEVSFKKIFFTGSTKVGQIVYEAAAKHLTPVTLELGGKSPCIIDESADLALAAKRIVFGKFTNAGQTCIAPDFVWVNEKVSDLFEKHMILEIKKMYGESEKQTIASVINDANYKRLCNYLGNGEIVFGGYTNENDRYISPTVLKNITFDDDVMQEEIFGPILPLLTYKSTKEIIEHNHKNDKPLAFYWFTKNTKEVIRIMKQLQFGGGCVNDVLIHIINKNVPFGGFQKSGMGNYHGKFGFDTFTHYKAIVNRKTWLDISFKYPPYDKKSRNLRRLIALLR